MRTHYDFSEAKPNPHAKRLKKPVTLRLETEVVDYFKQLADETGLRYQTLINSFLRDCVSKKKRPTMEWRKGRAGS